MIDKILQEERIEFNELEKEIYKHICEMGCKILKYILEKADEEIKENRDKKQYRHKGYKTDCIKSIMGEVEYKRGVYEIKEKGKKKYKFLLEEKIQINKIGKMSSNLCEKILEIVCGSSYRKSSEIISSTSNQRVSHSGVRDIVLRAGKNIEDKEKEKAKLFKLGKLEKGNKEIPALFEEADGLWISLQGRDKEKEIQKKREKYEKEGKEFKEPKKAKSELKIYVSYEGWKKEARHSLVEKQYITGFINTKELKLIREAKLNERYNLEKIKMMVLNGDGAQWIKQLALKDQFYQKDSFHITQAINRNIKDTEDKEKLKELIKNKEYSKINNFLEKLKYKVGGEEKEVNKIKQLQSYLKDGLERYKDEVKDIPPAPEGMEFRNMGTCESQVFSVLTRRFSDRRMSFSRQGATMLSKVVALKIESKGKEILKQIETPIKIDNSVEEWIEAIEKNIKKIGKDKTTKLKETSGIKVLKKPFEGIALKEPFRVIRELTSILPRL